MSQERNKGGCSETSEDEKDTVVKHRGRGKPTEGLVDKTAILRNLGIVPGQTILDAGCGPPLGMRFSPAELKRTLRLLPRATVDAGEHFYMQLFEKRERS